MPWELSTWSEGIRHGRSEMLEYEALRKIKMLRECLNLSTSNSLLEQVIKDGACELSYSPKVLGVQTKILFTFKRL